MSEFNTTSYRWEQQDGDVSPLSFRLTRDGDSVLFEARVEQSPTRQISGFQPDLWQDDVAELFVISDHQPAGYWEFNFAAGGAWWAASFSQPRKIIKELPEQVEVLEANSGSDSWSIKAKIFGIGQKLPMVGNVCGILGAQPRRYVSFLPLTDEIDFHCPQCYQPLSFAE